MFANFETCVKWGHITRAMSALYVSETKQERKDTLERLSRFFTRAYKSDCREMILDYFNVDFTAREQEYFYDQIERDRNMETLFLVAQQGAILCVANFLNRFAQQDVGRDLLHCEIRMIDDVAEAIYEDIKERANADYQAACL